MTDSRIVTAHPAATVVLLRDGPGGVETLLLRRNSKLAFHGGSWVFPGGRVDDGDFPADAPGDLTVAARWAAVREAHEEAGLRIRESDLVWLSHWTTPDTNPKRFATWFYAAKAGREAVEIDGGEIHDHRWIRPGEALEAQRSGDIELPAPTYVSLLELLQWASADAALAAIRTRAPAMFTPRNHPVPGGRISLYEEDVAYVTGDLEQAGPRHRLWMLDDGWRYEREL